MLATGSFDASVGIWRRYDNDDLIPRPIAAPKGLDFDARDRDIQNDDEEEDDDEWRFAIVLDGHESEVKSVAWSTGGNLLATCSRDKSVWIWEEVGEDDYETIAVLQEHEGDVKCVAWHPEEEFLASASYDDEIRLWREDIDDWGCCGVLRGHEGTVWGVVWEGVEPHVQGEFQGHEGDGENWIKRREKSGPRLLSCSDDLTVRVWRRRPKEKVQQNPMSIIRSGSSEEDWVEEARLPTVHSRPIYAVAWSRNGRVASTGGDGSVIVYEERWKAATTHETEKMNVDGVDASKDTVNGSHSSERPIDGMSEQIGKGAPKSQAPITSNGHQDQSTKGEETMSASTEWVVIAQLESAHGVFEINHIAWAPRPIQKGESSPKQEDLIVTTGDDGLVKVWELDS